MLVLDVGDVRHRSAFEMLASRPSGNGKTPQLEPGAEDTRLLDSVSFSLEFRS
jgi:hypothetical protein